ncbi:Chlorophyll a/b binding protein domain-containing protein [Artemisia annua]|uniref:Chlorophyll a/b binding protein domain-containing protein n=1 Tax=Artemisia annua TaxID=35608 RepID=A0A2U1MBW4_ARTAN|nr:Chlorophyll a/b binding protein domain-containing protein [Artemisia annua]
MKKLTISLYLLSMDGDIPETNKQKRKYGSDTSWRILQEKIMYSTMESDNELPIEFEKVKSLMIPSSMIKWEDPHSPRTMAQLSGARSFDKSYSSAELDSSVDDPPIPPRISSQENQQHTQITNPFINSSSSSMPQGFRPYQSDQSSKNYIFSNALSSPVRRSLQNYHISQEGYGVKNNDHQKYKRVLIFRKLNYWRRFEIEYGEEVKCFWWH